MKQRILVLHDSKESDAQPLVANVEAALRDARLEYEALDASRALHLPQLGEYSSVLLCSQRLDEIGRQGVVDLTDYVAEGGGLVLLNRAWHEHLAEFVGLERRADPPPYLPFSQTDEGLCIVGNDLAEFRGIQLTREDLAGHSAYDVRPSDRVSMVATSKKGHPLGWKICHGEGTALFWNTELLRLKRSRGLIVQSVMAVQPIGILPIANVGVIQIDDFPAPLSHDDMAPVVDEFPDLSATEFYAHVWHPDMLALADRHGLSYTYLVVFSYNHTVKPPFGFSEWKLQRLSAGGDDVSATVHAATVASRNGELGLHGYNHLSLLKELWPSPEAVKQAAEAARTQWERDGLGPLPTTFVPPNNQYDAEGVAALSEGFPSLKVVSGSYYDHAPESGGQREVGPEPWNPGLFSIPRATSGYEYSEEMKFDAVSQLSCSGIWTHFVHADDVFDLPEGGEPDESCRNPKGRPWRGIASPKSAQRGLLYEFERWIQDFRKRFPWLRFVLTREALPILQEHLASEWRVSFEDGHARLSAPRGGFFQLRCNSRVLLSPKKSKGAKILDKRRYGDSFVYTLTATADEVELVFKPMRLFSW